MKIMRYVLFRVLVLIPLLFSIFTVVFLVIHVLPGDDPLALDFTRNLRISKIRREIRMIGDLTEEQRKTLMKEAACCPISNTLGQGVEIEDVAVP